MIRTANDSLSSPPLIAIAPVPPLVPNTIGRVSREHQTSRATLGLSHCRRDLDLGLPH